MVRVGCPSRDELAAFVHGELSDADLSAIGGHMESCPDCDRAAEALDDDPVAALLRDSGSDATHAGGRAFPRDFTAPRALPARLGGYEVVEELGRGGMGVVYKGWDADLKRHAALKVIRSGEYATAHEAVRFRREAEAVARVRHHGLVQIYEVGLHDATPYLALEYVPGGSLERHLAGAPQPPAAAARLVIALADAIQAAHDGGVVHRDLKPANVLLSRPPTAHEWFVKVADFGLARCVAGSPRVTATGTVAGTPAYMAPEQVAGRSSVGPGADVYALGVILYEALTGHPPFRGEAVAETLSQVLHTDPVPPSRLRPRIPRDLETVCLKCLEKDPRRRYVTARELADDLGRFLADVPVRARRAGPGERFLRACRRNPLPAALAGLTTASLVAGAAGASFFAVRASRNADDARVNETRALDGIRAADAARGDLRQTLYSAQMHLAGQAAYLNRSWPQIDALLEPWRPAPDRPDRPGWEWYYLASLGRRDVMRLPHKDPVQRVVWNPAGTRLAVLDLLRGGEIWDAASADAARIVLPSESVAGCAAWSPDGTRLATGCHTGGVRIWRAADGVLLRALPTQWGVLMVAWSRDGRRVAAVTPGDAAVRVWDPDTGADEPNIPIGANQAHQFALSPDWSRLAAVSPGRTEVIDLVGGRPRVVVNGSTMVLGWSPDGRRLAACIPPNQISVLDPETGRAVATAKSRHARVTGIDWSPDGRSLCSVSSDAVVRVWAAGDGTLSHTFLGHTGPLSCVGWSETGDRIVSAGVDQEARVWPAPRPATDVADLARGMSWSGDSARLAVVTDSGAVHVVDRATQRVTGPAAGLPAYASVVAWSPNGGRVACGGRDGVVRVLDAATGGAAYQLGEPGAAVTALAWDRGGDRLAVAQKETGVRVWGVVRRQILHTPVRHGPDVYAMAWAPDGSLALGVGDELRVWDEAGAESVLAPARAGTSTLHEAVTRIAWGPAGAELAIVSGQVGRVSVWARGATQPRLVLPVSPDSPVCGLAWSPDGRRIAASAYGTNIRFWDAISGSSVFSLDADAAPIDLAWSPDGTSLAGLTRNGGLVTVWDAAAGYAADPAGRRP